MARRNRAEAWEEPRRLCFHHLEQFSDQRSAAWDHGPVREGLQRAVGVQSRPTWIMWRNSPDDRPERGGPSPAVCFLMDAHGIREELRDMAWRLATVGYDVLLPNLYYRAGQDTIFGAGVMEDGSPEHTRMRAVRTKMTIPPVMRDIAAMLACVDQQDAVTPGPVGCHGYCMSGPYALAAAARYPDRVVAAASFYGTWLISEAEESPHRPFNHVQGELYMACAEHDALAPLPIVEELQGFFTQAGAPGEIEPYPGVHHGFAFPQRWCDDQPAAERHWEQLLALYRRQLTALPSGGQRSGHAYSARVVEQGDEHLARWTTEPRVLITVTPERIATRAPRGR